MSASEEWNKKIAAMKQAREEKRAGTTGARSPSPLSKSMPSVTPATSGSRRGSPPGGTTAGTGSRRGPRGSIRRGSTTRGAPAGPGGATNANAARELNLVKAELKILQMKYDNEVKKRESVEKQLQTLKESASSAIESTKPK